MVMVPSTVRVGQTQSCDEAKTKRKARVLLALIVTTLVCMAGLVLAWDHQYKKSRDTGALFPVSIDTSDTLKGPDDDSIDDDATRDDVCKAYLMQFLNGTTDTRDVCEGMLNAYDAGDCHDFGGGRSVISSTSTNDDDDGNHTKEDDDVLIDDAYEAWECCSSIYKFYTVHCHEPEMASFQLLGIVLVLVLCGLVNSLLHTLNAMWIPEAGACIMVGATVGGLVKLISPHVAFANDQNLSSFNNNLFLHILLPPIVFASSLKINKRAFWRHVGPILSLAIVGTAMSAVLIGLITCGLTHLLNSTKLPMLDSLLFGSLASSIDPVATLGILDAVGVGQTDTLYILVFGESLLNDGVAIVLFEALVRHVGSDAAATVSETCMRFLVVTVGSLAIGLGCGVLCMLYFWALRDKHSPVAEVAMFFCWALIPYYISDGVGLSGIISIMTVGFLMDYYVVGRCQSEEAEWMDYVELQCNEQPTTATERCRNHPTTFMALVSRLKIDLLRGRGGMSQRSRHHVVFCSDVIASLMETAIFSYLGLFLFSDKYMIDLRLNATAVVGCIASRAFMVLVMGPVINAFVWLDMPRTLRRWAKRFSPRTDTEADSDVEDETTIESSIGSAEQKVFLTRNTQLILFLSGVRGAVSFALVENIPVYNALTRRGSMYKAELKAMTSSSILFTVFVFGASTYFTVKSERQAEATTPVQQGGLMRRFLSQPLASFESDEYENRDISSLNTPNDA